MRVVIDSNVLFKTLISQGTIVNLIFDKNLELFAPEKLKEEFVNNKEEILSKSKLSETEFDELVSLLFGFINVVSLSEYKGFISEAKQLLREHIKDVESVALALKLNCLVWTYENIFFEIKLGISTKQISNKLKSSE